MVSCWQVSCVSSVSCSILLVLYLLFMLAAQQEQVVLDGAHSGSLQTLYTLSRSELLARGRCPLTSSASAYKQINNVNHFDIM